MRYSAQILFLSWLFTQCGPLACQAQQGSNKSASVQSQRNVDNPSPPTKTNGMATVQSLVDGLGSKDARERYQTASAIINLRNHYQDEAKQLIVSKGDSGSYSSPRQSGFILLQCLRPTSPDVAQIVSLYALVNFNPPHAGATGLGESSPVYSASDLLERMSLPALPSLAKLIAKSPVPSGDQTNDVRFVPLLRSLNILDPAAPLWLKNSAVEAVNNSERIALTKNAAYLKSHTNNVGTRSFVAPYYLSGRPQLEGGYNQPTINALSLNTIPIDWDALSQARVLDKKSSRDQQGALSSAVDAAVLTMQMIQYGIVQRLETNTNGRSKMYPPYTPEARIDAIRVLGALRSDMAPWVVWEQLQLRQMPTQQFVDWDKSENTYACIRALGQIDVPAVKMLTNDIANEWTVKSQRAATYALGRVLGRYSVPFIEREIAIRKQAARDDTDLHDQCLTEVQRLESMLELGKEKKWFEGDYYGAHDPHAYDLVFDTASAPAKMSQNHAR